MWERVVERLKERKREGEREGEREREYIVSGITENVSQPWLLTFGEVLFFATLYVFSRGWQIMEAIKSGH